MTSPIFTNNSTLHDTAKPILSQHEADEGALTIAQLAEIKQLEPQDKKRSVRSSLFELKSIQSIR